MKKTIWGLFGVIALVIITASLVRADMIDDVQVNDLVKLSVTISGYNGGPFSLEDLTTGDNWLTFCLEKTEYFNPANNYHVDSIETYAVAGGGGASGGKDELDPRTAFLYYHFRNQDLGVFVTGFDYSSNSNTALQEVIWFLEGEGGTIDVGMETTLYNAANSSSWNSIGNVRVLNISGTDYNPAQSQLTLVPEPGSLLLVGLGLLGIGILRRKQ